MSIVGMRRGNGPVEVALVSEGGNAATVVTGLDELWAAVSNSARPSRRG